jgi:putative spermidine/putrescine transport system ATP-binding protein
MSAVAGVALSDVTKRFGSVEAVSRVSLQVEEGEFFSLLGPSGCGKTTILRMLAGFITPSAGVISIGGQNVTALPPEKRHIGIVFQNYAIFPHMNVYDNIAFGLRMRKLARPEIERRVGGALEQVGLRGYERRYQREMSGGEQQRVALARVLVTEPRILLLDEPLSALDAVVRVSLRDEIRRIQTALGVTTLYVTHDQEEALAISDRIVVMRDGQIEQVGTAEEIYGQPASRFVAGFIGKMSQLPGTVEASRLGVIRCGAHRLRVPPGALEGLAEGSAVTVLVRPEAIGIARPDNDAPPAGSNALSARIEAVTFLGSVRRLGLDAGGQHLVADVPTAFGGPFRRGDLVSLAFPPDACRVIADQGGRTESDLTQM